MTGRTMRTMRRVGWTDAPGVGGRGSTPLRVYAALAPLTCARCGATITVGDRFTRRRASGQLGSSPICRACAPFGEVG